MGLQCLMEKQMNIYLKFQFGKGQCGLGLGFIGLTVY